VVFVERKRSCDGLCNFLVAQGVQAASIHGNHEQWHREEAIKSFKAGTCRVLVATSLAARGLDIPGVEHVVNYDMPSKIETYTHRIGRTGRAGRQPATSMHAIIYPRILHRQGLATSYMVDPNRKFALVCIIYLNKARFSSYEPMFYTYVYT
jgi:superfamily II DNA/RNA helicase